MKRKIRISVSEKPELCGVMACRNVSVRERLLRLLIGEKKRIAVLIPGEAIDEIAICERKGMDTNGKHETAL